MSNEMLEEPRIADGLRRMHVWALAEKELAGERFKELASEKITRKIDDPSFGVEEARKLIDETRAHVAEIQKLLAEHPELAFR